MRGSKLLWTVHLLVADGSQHGLEVQPQEQQQVRKLLLFFNIFLDLFHKENK